MKHDLVNLSGDTEMNSGGYHQMQTRQKEIVWNKLQTISVNQALEAWYQTLPKLTEKNYRSGFNRIIELGLLNPESNLQCFALINHEAVVDEIKLTKIWSEATCQARAAGYISFTAFLQRRTQGIVSKATTSKEGVSKTFFKIREKVKTPALSKEQTKSFMHELRKINYRDYLIAKVILQGGKRKGEVLVLQKDDIDFEHCRITFNQTKTRGVEKQTIINYPKEFIIELSNHLGTRSGLVFVTRNLKRISPYQLDRTFSKAGNHAGVPFRVTPHVLRVTLVTRLKELRIQDTDIMKITGHANPAQLSSYDKSDLADNATLEHQFI